jgi:hypothetical protein
LVDRPLRNYAAGLVWVLRKFLESGDDSDGGDADLRCTYM